MSITTNGKTSRLYKIKDFCIVGDGAHTSIKRQSSGIMYLTSKNFKPSGLELATVDFISESDYIKYFGSSKKALITPLEGDVLFGIIGSLGVPCVVKKNDIFGISSSVAILRPQKGLISKYLYYFMISSVFQGAIEAIKSGVAQSFLSLEMIRSLPLIVPNNLEQERIAAILSAYDDLIENNDRRIALLEKMAEEIYREWFVRLRFPGHEQATFHKGIPEGWAWETLENLGFLGRGKSKHRPRNDLSLYGGDYPFIQTGEVKEASSSFYITNHTQTYNKKDLAQSKLWNPGTLLITIAANIAETAILTYSACIPDSIIGFIPNHEKVSAEYIKYSVEHLKMQIQNISQGTTQDNLSQSKLETFDFLVPSQSTMSQFIEFSQPLFLQIKNLLLKNQHLKLTRDRLLTRLISGKLSVEDLDIQFPPSMTTDA